MIQVTPFEVYFDWTTEWFATNKLLLFYIAALLLPCEKSETCNLPLPSAYILTSHLLVFVRANGDERHIVQTVEVLGEVLEARHEAEFSLSRYWGREGSGDGTWEEQGRRWRQHAHPLPRLMLAADPPHTSTAAFKNTTCMGVIR